MCIRDRRRRCHENLIHFAVVHGYIAAVPYTVVAHYGRGLALDETGGIGNIAHYCRGVHVVDKYGNRSPVPASVKYQSLFYTVKSIEVYGFAKRAYNRS